MPATRIRRHRFTVLLIGAVLCLGSVTGCARQKIPTSYTDSVKEDFLNGCKKTAKADGEITAVSDFCTCAWTAIKKDVPFGTFKKVNNQLTDEPGKLPSSITKAYDSCKTS